MKYDKDIMNREKRVMTRLTAQEEKILRELAAKDGRTISGYLRTLLIKKLQSEKSPE